MFWEDNKKIASVLAKKGAKGEKIHAPAPMNPEVVKNEDGTMDGRHLAAQDMMAALHEKSPMKYADALKNFIDIHMTQPQKDEEDSSASES